jgi:hypothetical protein
MLLPEILQTLHIGMKTALVTLTCGKVTGRIWFEDGSVVHAKVESVEARSLLHDAPLEQRRLRDRARHPR